MSHGMIQALTGHDPVLRSVLDALPASVSLLNDAGQVVSANQRWASNAAVDGLCFPFCRLGASYLDACKEAESQYPEHAPAIARGIRAVLAGRLSDFCSEVAIRAEDGGRVFSTRVVRTTGGVAGAVVVQEDITDQRRAEYELQASEAKFRSLIENASDVITILDPEGKIQYESPSSARILGYASGHRIGQSSFEFVHADDLPRTIAAFRRSLQFPGKKIPVEYRCRHSDGSWRIFEGTVKNLLADPSVGGLVVSCHEVTERKRAEEAQARLTAVMDSTPNFVTITDSHGRLSYANRATRTLIGLQENVQVSNLNLTDLHPQWVSDQLLHEGIPTAIREGAWTGETALLDHSGQEVPVLQVLLAHRNLGGGVEFFSMIAYDITERKRAEEALRESHEIFRQIAENINETLWIFDLDQGRPVYISPGYERTWGRSVESIYEDPSSFLQMVTATERQPGKSASRMHGGKGRDDELRICHPDGSTRWLRGRSFPIHDARGSVCRIVGLTEDITDRKQLEHELRQAQRLEAIGHLAAGVAHEINTPVQYIGDNLRFLREAFDDLTSILGKHRELLDVLRLGRDASGLMEQIEREAEAMDLEYILGDVPRSAAQALEGVERVAEIVRAMKEFSHPGSSERKPLDLNRAIQSTLTVARNEWKYVAELILDLDPELPHVPCFPGELNQAVLNIVINAAHAIADVVGDGSQGRGTLTVSTRSEAHWVELRVRDTGTGIPEEVRARIFDPFFTTKEVGRGTGQGLTLAHSVIVEKHGGSLTFETEPGCGTTFIIRLPLDDGGAAAPQEAAS